ncbi:MAG: zinc ribbon domain-containing protein [Rhodospirillales bacterium]|nr:zinc ribbon domain-containing protein [Rhodospirillales bacterium]
MGTRLTTRDDIIRQFHADRRPLTAAVALSVNYAQVTQAARVRLGAEPYWSFITQEERDKAAASGAAMPDGSYPILSCEGDNSVDTAIHAVGRAGADHDTVRAHIIKRANSLDCASKIPENWNKDGSLKDESAASKTTKDAVAAAAPPAEGHGEPTGGNGTPFEPAPYHADPDETVKCPTCQKMDDADASFCDQCGTKLAGSDDVVVGGKPAGADYQPVPYHADPDEIVTCPACEKVNDTDASFCDQCGHKLAGDPDVKVAAVVAAAPPADGARPASGEGSTGDAEVDAGMDVLIANLLSDIDALKKQQAKDPGNGTGEDAVVQSHIDQLEALAKTLQGAQAADSAASESPEPPAATPAPDAPPAPSSPQDADPLATTATALADAPGATPGSAEGIPNDADDNGPGPGAIEATEICQNPDCGHTGGVHADDAELGENSGACTTPGCNCPGMIPAGQQVDDPADSGTGANDGQSNAGGPPAPDDAAETKAAAAAVGAQAFAPGDSPAPATEPAAQAPPVQGAPAPALPPLDPMPEVTTGPPFTIPVAWLENAPTGDGRMIDAPSADAAGLTWRTPPLPLMGLKTSPHDPSGMSPNDPAVLIGRIETITREGAKGTAAGHLLMTDDGMEFAAILEQMGRLGVSIDVGSAQVQITADPTVAPTDDVFDLPVMEHLVEGEILGMTVCPFAAFAGAYIVLGDGSDVPDAELPAAPDGASMAIHFVDEQPCLPCSPDENTEYAVVASGGFDAASLLHPPAEWFANPGFVPGDERLHETLDPKTGKPSGKFACPITIDEHGRVFGHIAQWGVCHQSPNFLNNGQCVLAPRSRTDYAAFHGTGSVLTAEGELIGVGRMTADTGHAPTTPGYSYAQAVAHYDNSGLCTALVRAGEDEFGVWVAGSLHPSASEEQVFTMRANPPSGDWRPFGAGRELCNVLFVNHAGFPMVKATQDKTTGRVTSLIAAGVPLFSMPETPADPPTIEQRLAAIEAASQPVFELARDHLRSRRAAIA